MKQIFLVLVVLLLAVSNASFANDNITMLQAMNVNFPKDVIRISAGDDSADYTDVAVEIANEPLQRQVGLMYRQDVPEGSGMLFVFSAEQPLAFWMKNTYVPLDMYFIDSGGVIISISTANPLDETPVPSAGPAMAVLEMKAGSAAKYGIDVGHKVFYSAFRHK